jgi:phosphoheptose isomerase
MITETDYINIENIGVRFTEIVSSPEWQRLQADYNASSDIYVLGHGGNMGVADHSAVDMTRLSNGTKNAMCPGSCVVATSLINDVGWNQWMVAWLQQRTSTRTNDQIKNSLVYGISSSGNSPDVLKALQWASDNGMKTVLVTGKEITSEIEGLNQVVLGTDYYHTTEVLTLLLQYQLTHGSGNECPPIGKNSPEELTKLNLEKTKIRENSYPDELTNIGVDFDNVIHMNSKGFYDGSIYDEPVPGVKDALKLLSEKYSVVVYTVKAKPDRGLINGKTGVELVWDWLKKHDLSQYVSKVTAEKPRAVAYIDDKAIEFQNWKTCLDILKNKSII